jgi:DNA-binding GntR family transcriptional regulator
MLILIKSMKGGQGKSIPMYSRAGKSTINQYLAFSESAEERSAEVKKHVKEKDIDELEREVEELLEMEAGNFGRYLKALHQSFMFFILLINAKLSPISFPLYPCICI